MTRVTKTALSALGTLVVSGLLSFSSTGAFRLPTGTSDPVTNVAEGNAYYNTTDDVLYTYDGSAWNAASGSAVPWDIDSSTPLNGVTRVRSSTWNFLQNASVEYWLSGTSVAPTSWTLAGDATVSRSTVSWSLGSYVAQIVFGTANTGELYQAFGAHANVDYVFSAYVERTSGTGTARLVAQEADDDFTEFVSVALPTGSGQQLVTLNFPAATTENVRFSIKSGNTTASTWKIDEVMVQESKDVATTWQPRFLDDTTNNLYAFGNVNFAGGITDVGKTQGSVLFAGAGGVHTDDNPNFFWDDSSNRLGIGTTTPATQLDIKSAAAGPLVVRSTGTSVTALSAYTATSILRFSVAWTTAGLTFRNEDNTPLTFGTQTNQNSLVLTDAGRLGIGTGSSAATLANLHVVGTAGLGELIAAGTATTNVQALSVTQAWNSGGTTFTALKANITDTASAVASKLLDLQVGSATMFSIDKYGKFAVGTTAGTTASTTQTQGNGALTSGLNEISTVANEGDTVTLPTAVAGLTVVVSNNGANTLQIFPASGDNLGEGANASTRLVAGATAVFRSYDATNWEKTGAKRMSTSANTGTIATTGSSYGAAQAPCTCRLIAAYFNPGDALAANDTNYITFSLTEQGQNGDGSAAMLAATDANTTKATGGTALGQYDNRSLTLTGTAADRNTTAGDRILITYTATGTLANSVSNTMLTLVFEE